MTLVRKYLMMMGTMINMLTKWTCQELKWIQNNVLQYVTYVYVKIPPSNLDPNSAYYDPKTRSMRGNPNPQVPAEESEFDGENFVRFTGDTAKHAGA
ncbi:pre-mRNA-splicing factor Slu7-like isoform 1-T4 [Glossina fuscipes fuscipes]